MAKPGTLVRQVTKQLAIGEDELARVLAVKPDALKSWMKAKSQMPATVRVLLEAMRNKMNQKTAVALEYIGIDAMDTLDDGGPVRAMYVLLDEVFGR